MTTLKIIHAAASIPSLNEECPYCSKWMNDGMNKLMNN